MVGDVVFVPLFCGCVVVVSCQTNAITTELPLTSLTEMLQ